MDYEVEDKKIVDTNYNCCNAFNGDLILRVHDIKNIKDFESNEVYYLMEYGSLLGLRNSVISKGLDKTYAYNVLSDGVYNKSLSLYDVARIYVLLVNSDNRVETNNIEKTIN